jgi:hypothetical protein
MSAAGAGGNVTGLSGALLPAAAAFDVETFPPERVYMVSGHGEDTGRRFALQDNQYGAIPTKCGRSIYVDVRYLEDFFTNHVEIPIPFNNSLVKSTTKSIMPHFNAAKPHISNLTLAGRTIPRNYKIYRPQLPDNTENSQSRWRMPALNIDLLLVSDNNDEAEKPQHEFLGKVYNNVKPIIIEISGVLTSSNKVVFPSGPGRPQVTNNGYRTLLWIEKSSYSKTFSQLTQERNALFAMFIKRLTESLAGSIFTFDDILIFAYMNSARIPILYSSFTSIRNDEEQKKEAIYYTKKHLSLKDILVSNVPLMFIYDYLSNITEGEPFIVLVPVCRNFVEGMAPRNRTYARRFSINKSKPAASVKEGGRRLAVYRPQALTSKSMSRRRRRRTRRN